MGEEDAEAAAATAQEYVKQYQDLTDDKVIPAFEIIASVAQGDPWASRRLQCGRSH